MGAGREAHERGVREAEVRVERQLDDLDSLLQVRLCWLAVCACLQGSELCANWTICRILHCRAVHCVQRQAA